MSWDAISKSQNVEKSSRQTAQSLQPIYCKNFKNREKKMGTGKKNEGWGEGEDNKEMERGSKGKKKTLKETLTKIITYQLIIVILIRILIQTGKTIKIQNKMLLTLRHLKNEH